MWTRSGLKTNTKAMLSYHYWKIFVIFLLVSIISGGLSSVGSFGSSSFNLNFNVGSESFVNGEDFDKLLPLIPIFASFISFIFLLSLAFSLFVVLPVTVGANKYILNAFKNKNDFSDVFFAFKTKYLSVVKTVALTAVYKFLWTLLFIIPGIVKSYSYRMVPFILTDNPSIGARRAIDLSKKMTDGEKLDMFVLDLSFIGWYLLGCCACGLGVVFVVPYHESTFANLYMVLRDKALMTGACTYEELGYASPSQNDNTVPPQGYNNVPPQGFGGYNAPNQYSNEGYDYRAPVDPFLRQNFQQPPVQPDNAQQPPVQPPVEPATDNSTVTPDTSSDISHEDNQNKPE